MARNRVNARVDVYRPLTTEWHQDPTQWVEIRPKTPCTEDVPVSIGTMPAVDQLLFGKISNMANFLVGHRSQNILLIAWQVADADLQMYDVLQYRGDFYLLESTQIYDAAPGSNQRTGTGILHRFTSSFP